MGLTAGLLKGFKQQGKRNRDDFIIDNAMFQRRRIPPALRTKSVRTAGVLTSSPRVGDHLDSRSNKLRERLARAGSLVGDSAPSVVLGQSDFTRLGRKTKTRTKRRTTTGSKKVASAKQLKQRKRFLAMVRARKRAKKKAKIATQTIQQTPMEEC